MRFCILTLIFLIACKPKREAIVYQDLPQYFVKNTIADSNQFVWTAYTQAMFDSVFAPAAVMDIKRPISPLDFNIQWASALVLKTDNHAQEIIVKQLQYKGKTIQVHYSIKQSEAGQSYYSRACKILLFEPYYKAFNCQWILSKSQK